MLEREDFPEKVEDALAEFPYRSDAIAFLQDMEDKKRGRPVRERGVVPLDVDYEEGKEEEEETRDSDSEIESEYIPSARNNVRDCK